VYVSIEKTDNGYIVRVNREVPYGPTDSETRVYNKFSEVVKYVKSVMEPEQGD
jgi:hypothetical protein